jgi:hypothetical protein
VYAPASIIAALASAVFARGRISPPVTPDHSMRDLRGSLERMSRLAPTGLFPGHGAPVLTAGSEHIQRAAEALAALRLPRLMA